MNTTVTSEFDRRVEKYEKEQEQFLCNRMDKVFRVLLILEWIFCVITALFVSPKTWSGEMASVHIHLWTAVILGGAIVSAPILLIYIRPGTKLSRYCIACSQMLFGTLLIHLMGGRIEAHFYIFGSLAFIAAYRQWPMLIPATIIVAVDHLIRGIYWPQSVYGVITGAEWRWLEHASWVIFEDIFLILTIVQGQKDMKKIAISRVELEQDNKIKLKRERDDAEKSRELAEQLVEELKEKQQQIIQSAKLASLGEQASGVAHELNNPLFLVSGFAELIKHECKDEEHIKTETLTTYVDDIIENSIRMKKIIQHLREFSRQATHTLERTRINDVIEKSFTLLNQQFRLMKISIVKDLDKSNPEVNADRIKLEQVFVNLLTNCRDAIETRYKTEGGTIKIITSTKNGSVKIEIFDNGCGMSQETIDKIFQPFYTTKEVGKGTGLGGSISYGIIKEHEGDIICDSKVGEGTKFTIVLKKYEETMLEQQ